MAALNKSPLRLKVRAIEANLLAHYYDATPVERAAGLAWYPAATRLMRRLAKRHQVPLATVAAVTAAISPQCDWATNCRIAAELLAGVPSIAGGAIQKNVDTARRILRHQATDVAHYFKDAPKVEAFASNLAGDGDRVTIDVHAAQAALNDPAVVLTLRRSPYQVFADCYGCVAYEIGVRPADFQAIVWLVWKRRYPAADKRRIRRVWADDYAA
jgi:hypothetical protein